MKKNTPKFILIAGLLAVVILFFVFDLGHYFTLENLKEHQQAFQDYYQQNKFMTIALYFLVYVVMAALSLPGAAVMTLAGGALLGLGAGTVVVSFASSIGATLAFIVARFLLRESVQGKFGEKLNTINAGVRKDGAFYLFTLRLVPVFPFFIINLVMGLTPIRIPVFYIVSQLGMLPGTIVYVNAGTQLAKIQSLQDILSPALIFSFVLLGVFPLIAKAFLSFIKRRRKGAKWPKPAPLQPDHEEVSST
jgi:uncharacterized membrane protein YdjX (TVP38/TMEM64 family)